jgi:hypothetical protein
MAFLVRVFEVLKLKSRILLILRLLNCTCRRSTNNRVRPLVDCLRKDSCEVVTADESHPIVVCFCVQKRRCKIAREFFASKQSADFESKFSGGRLPD